MNYVIKLNDNQTVEIPKDIIKYFKTFNNLIDDVMNDDTEISIYDDHVEPILLSLAINWYKENKNICKFKKISLIDDKEKLEDDYFSFDIPNVSKNDLMKDTGDNDQIIKPLFEGSHIKFFQSLVDSRNYADFMNLCDYLGAEHIIHYGCMYFAYIIHGKTPQEIRLLFNLDDNLTQEDMKKIDIKYEWITQLNNDITC